MRLPDNEIRDITKLLEEGKPLPDKYRFLLFGDDREIELVWNGKSRDVTNVVLPFQTIEHVDEPRPEANLTAQAELFDPATGRQLKGWTNKLIWGDNKFVLSSLKSGPLRDEIETNGGIKLIYIDPPFDVGADFSMDVAVGEDVFEKEANLLEEIAYRDTWGKGQDSFLAMIYERVMLMKSLLREDGAIYVHCDWRLNSKMRLLLGEIFGDDCFRNEIIWEKTTTGNKAISNYQYPRVYDSILFFTKSKDNHLLNIQYEPYGEDYIEVFSHEDERGRYRRQILGTRGADSIAQLELDGRIYTAPSGKKYFKQYLHESKGIPYTDFWTGKKVPDLRRQGGGIAENLNYPTQKPEVLLRRILESSSDEGDIVCDFFCGSGSLAAIAEKLGRKWICSDLGKFAIHTSRKRLINVQRELRSEGKDFRAFEILNLGRYERDFFVSGLADLDDSQRNKAEQAKEQAFNQLILSAYKAEPITGFRTFRGKRQNRVVAIGPANLPVSRLFAEEVVAECIEKGVTKVDLLAFEFEMGLFPSIQDDAVVLHSKLTHLAR